jgi:hypothetical protein
MKNIILTIVLMTAWNSVVAQNELSKINSVTLIQRQNVQWLVNGFPMYEMNDLASATVSHELLPYLKRGINVFEWRLQRSPHDPKKPVVFKSALDSTRLADGSIAPVASFQREIVINDAGGLVERSAIVQGQDAARRYYSPLPTDKASLGSWTQATSRLTHELQGTTPPLVDIWRLELNLDNAILPSLPWEGVPPVLTPADESTLRALAAQINTAISVNDVTALTHLFDSKIKRFALARRASKADIATALLTALTDIANPQNGLVFAPLDPSQLQFKSFEDSSLIEAVRADGTAAVQATGNGANRFRKRLFFCIAGGSWHLVE